MASISSSNFTSKVGRVVLFFAFWLSVSFAHADGVTVVSSMDTSFQLSGLNVECADISSIEHIEDSIANMKWVSMGNTHTFTFTDPMKYHVFKIRVMNNTERTEWKFSIPVPHLDYVYFYPDLDEGKTTVFSSGDLLKPGVRMIDDASNTFRVTIPQDKEKTFYIAVKSSGGLVMPVILEHKDAFYKRIAGRNLFFGVFAGIMIIMFLYNLVVFFYTKDRTYLYYIFYVLFIFLAQSSFIGASYYFVGDLPAVNNALMYVGSSVSGIFGCLFIRNFLKTYESLPKLNFGLSIIVVIYTVMLILSFLGFYEICFMIMQLAGLMVVVVFASISITLSFRGERFAKVYLVAWTPIFIGLVFLILRDNGLLPFTNMTNYMFPVGVILETVMLSLALADQINILKMDNERTHQRVIEEIHKNQELVKNQNLMLEEKVRQRTQELEDALNNLKSTQSQLVQSEKMASLGVLTAGIAHEINNPINFVTANVVPLRENIEDLNKLLSEYKNVNWDDPENEIARLNKLEEEIELDYMLNETKTLIDGIEEGARRTHGIVDGLKSFSRGDGGANSLSDVNKGIQSTLAVLKSRLKGVNLKKELDTNIPQIHCQIGKLNQVFLNLMNNAIDAMEVKNGPNSSKSVITVRTYVQDDHVHVEVEDEGEGMPEEVQKKIFEPFFTTKPIGKGTGLGLSISYGIVEEHNGEMKMESTPGVGSKFTVILPIEAEEEVTSDDQNA